MKRKVLVIKMLGRLQGREMRTLISEIKRKACFNQIFKYKKAQQNYPEPFNKKMEELIWGSIKRNPQHRLSDMEVRQKLEEIEQTLPELFT